MEKVYVILVNYNGWKDTVECLENLLRCNHPNYQVVVVDNHSTDNSIDELQKWAQGNHPFTGHNTEPKLLHLSQPALAKPVQYILYSSAEAATGGSVAMEEPLEAQAIAHSAITTKYPVVFIASDKNAGFSAGNNVAIRFAQQRNDFSHIWLLNNDTVAEPESLTALHEQAAHYAQSGKKAGIIGSKILYYDYPETIQVIAGFSFNKWTGTSHRKGCYEKDEGQYDREIEFDHKYCIFGASMFVSKEFLEDVGLLGEEYFMYWEELDWAQRSFLKGWEIGYVWKSKVYHKMGRSTGKDGFTRKKGKFADYYGLKNRYKVSRKYFPETAWIHFITFPLLLMKRLFKGEANRIPTAVKAFRDSYETGKTTPTFEINQPKSH